MSDSPALFKRVRDGAILPQRQTPLAAGLDLPACLDAPVTLAPGDIAIIPTGWQVAVPDGHEGQVRPRSGLSTKHGVTVPNAPGTIDADYRGELKVALINLGREPFTIEHGMRIAQLIIAPVSLCEVREVGELPESHPTFAVRGAGGFGSTGLR
jgi:dUTP pyrophosphatase